MKKIFSLIALIFLIGLVSAQGLELQTSDININKTFQEDYKINLSIKNTESFTFYNITSENQNIIEIPKINKLQSGQTANFTATIKANTNFNGTINIIGEYETQIGTSNENYQINVNYQNGIDKCNLNIVKGDNITWINENIGELKLREKQENTFFATIQTQENFTKLFNEEQQFYYEGFEIIPITKICKINVMDDEGLVHNTDYDAQLNLNISIIYPATTIQPTFLTDQYEINSGESKQDIFKIENTGETLAKINLKAEWITFSLNNFNLNPGESKTISYTISPQLLNTSDTNKTYIKNINISGNFQKIEKQIQIIIPYKKISEEDKRDIDPEFLLNVLDIMCYPYTQTQNYPSESYRELCERGNNYYNSSSENEKIEINEQVLRDLSNSIRDSIINEKSSNQKLKNYLDEDKKEDNEKTNQTEKVRQELTELSQSQRTSNEINLILLIILIGGTSLYLAVTKYLETRNHKKTKENLGLFSGEKL